MGQRIIVIGAGIIGAAIGFNLARAGHQVTILDAAGAAAQASGRSFGWINASFFADVRHFRLRAAGIAAWRRLDPGDVEWSGSLWFEEQGPGFDRMQAQLNDLKYPTEEIDKAEFSELEPHVAGPPERALRLPLEGAAETAAVTRSLLQRARAEGATVMTGIAVQAIDTTNGAVTGLQTEAGPMKADQIVVAAGTGSPALLEPLGVALPMLRRPGLLVMTQPVPPVLAHILVTPDQEVRQLPDGRILAPTSPNHQADDAETLSETAEDLAQITMTRLRDMLPAQDLLLDQITLALRPVPQDGLPVVGAAGPDGLYIATMHSGVTLAAIIGELVTQELTNGGPAELLQPYRPDRVQS